MGEIVFVLAVAVIFFGVGLVWTLWMLRDLGERVVSIEDDLVVDRRTEIEGTRALGAVVQRERDLTFLDTFEGCADRVIVSEWTRPDWIDERVPEPPRVSRGFIAW